MPEILVISGKGGAGKTSITAALAHLAPEPLICDLDVDAPDLHLLLDPQVEETHDFWSGNQAIIDPSRCDGCGVCMERCLYGAVGQENGVYAVDPARCEGCKVCVHFCPQGAIEFPPRHCGQWFISSTRMGPLAHAQLFPGQENSGRLVALLRQQAKQLAQASGRDLIISDGPPGIGCPVISSLSGVDLAVLVAEPSLSGLHDLERVLELCRHFKTDMAVIVNKYDLSPEQTRAIQVLAEREAIPVLAHVPHDLAFVEAMVAGRAVTEHCGGPVAAELRRAWSSLAAMISQAQAA